MAERGVIRNREFAQQIRDFSGLRFGKITPTDIDGFIDYQNKLFIFFEGKHGDSAPPYGQKLALERLCDACADSRKLAVVLLLRHQAAAGVDIDFGSLPVTSFRMRGSWQFPKSPITCRAAVEKLIAAVESKVEPVPNVMPIQQRERERSEEASFVRQREQFESDFEKLVRSEPAPW